MEKSAEELAGNLGAVLERLVALIRSLNTDNPMSRTASGTLATLERSGPSRLTALATREGVTQPAMTQLVSRLEDNGLVRREPDPSDGRVVRVVITDEGLALMTRRRAERAGRLASLLDQLPLDQRQVLIDSLPALSALADTHLAAPAAV
jgi:DNA-binding MarR family transcriptional regulator